jgi:hypothetical protein
MGVAYSQDLRDRVMAAVDANYLFPDYGRNPPFSLSAVTLAPAESIGDRFGVGIVQGLKSAVAVRFDHEPHLLDRLPDFSGLDSAAPFDPFLAPRSRRRGPRPHASPSSRISSQASPPP